MSDRQAFESLVLPHLDAAYNLARWLLRNDQAAEDAVQDAALRALRYIDSLRGADARPWLLGIVRNTCFSAMERVRSAPQQVDFDEAEYEAALGEDAPRGNDPAAELQRRNVRREIDAAISALSPPLREAIVLREFEDLDYAQIAGVLSCSESAIKSLLFRAYESLRGRLAHMA